MNSCRSTIDAELAERLQGHIAQLQDPDVTVCKDGEPVNGTLHWRAMLRELGPKEENGKALAALDLVKTEAARGALVQLSSTLADASKQSVVLRMPPIDAASALAGTHQPLDLVTEAAVDGDMHKPAIQKDEAVHPYLRSHLKRARFVDPFQQQGRKSPAGAAPGTPAAAGPPPGPSTPTTNGVDPGSEGIVGTPAKAACMVNGKDEEAMHVDSASHPITAQPSAREASVECTSVVQSMEDNCVDTKDTSRKEEVAAELRLPADAKDTSTAAADVANGPMVFATQQRRSSRKRARRDCDSEAVTPGPAVNVALDKPERPASRHSALRKRETVSEGVPAAAEPPLKQQASAARTSGKKGASGKGKGRHAQKEDVPPSTEAGEPDPEILEHVKLEPCAQEHVSADVKHLNGLVTMDPDSGDVAVCSLEEQWPALNENLDVLAMAPDDEIVAEIISLQAELLQVAVANRKRCRSLLETVVNSLPEQAEQAVVKENAERQMEAFLQHMRALKRQAKMEKREAERREAAEALAAAEAVAGPGQPSGTAPAVATGRLRRATAQVANLAQGSDEDDDDEDTEDEIGGVPLPLSGDLLVDPFALEVPDALQALCAVCGDGGSPAQDQIVFCDRCNVAVHQHCYGIVDIPQGEWLCWPCRLYEDSQVKMGKSRDDIRPPRFKESGNPDYPHGSKDITCKLCPMKRGVFKQAVGEVGGAPRWVHVVCALWQGPEVTVAPSDQVDTIQGLDNIRPDSLSMTCAYCRQRSGATVKCAYGKCHTTFHPLCARKVGCFAVCRHQRGRARATYKTYCAQHSEAAARREKEAATRIAENGEKSAHGAKQAATEAAIPVEDLAALEAQIAAKSAALAYLQAIRYDLESARMLATQVEKREKNKHAVCQLLQQEYELVLSDPVQFARFDHFLGCRMHHHELVQLMQTSFDKKRLVARKSFAKHQQSVMQKQQQMQQRMDAMSPAGVGPVMGGRGPQPMFVGHGGQQPMAMNASAHMRGMGAPSPQAAERMSQAPQPLAAPHRRSLMGDQGGYGPHMASLTEAEDPLMRAMNFDQPPSNTSPLQSPLLDPTGAPQMAVQRDAAAHGYGQQPVMRGLGNRPMRSDHQPGSLGGGPPGQQHGQAGLGPHWGAAPHMHAGFQDPSGDRGVRRMRTSAGGGPDMVPMNAFGMGADMQHQNPHIGDARYGQVPPGGDIGIGALRGTSQMIPGASIPDVVGMGGGPMGAANPAAYGRQMRRSDPAAFGSQPGQRRDGMMYVSQQEQPTYGASSGSVQGTAVRGRSQRAAAQAARGSFAAAADPFAFMDE